MAEVPTPDTPHDKLDMPAAAQADAPVPRHATVWWQRPIVLSLGITLLLLALALGWPLLRWQLSPHEAAPAAQGLPWQVQADGAGGSAVFGLQLGSATLGDAEGLWPQDFKVALISVQGQAPALEAYVESFQAAFVNGKLVLSVAADPDWLRQAWDRSPRGEVEGGREGAVRRRELAPQDLDAARRIAVSALAFIPAARLDEATVVQRFGTLAQRHVGADGVVQLLYPERGVAVALPPAEGDAARAKPVIQYVAPRDFERLLRAPLQAAQAASAP